MILFLCLVCILLVPLAGAGLALIHQGLGRSRSSAHAMLSLLCAMAVAAIAFVLCGSSFAGFPAGASHSFTSFGVLWNWIGAEPFWGQGVLADGSSIQPGALVLCLEMFAVGLASMIPISAGADRWRLAPICLSTGLLAAVIFPLFCHWVWGGGWLAQLGISFGLGQGMLDNGGASSVQTLGGLTGLSVAWLLGPRRGKYNRDAIASAIPGHNIPLVLFGCMLTLAGWTGLNLAASLLFYGATLATAAPVIINTMVCASAACLTAAAATQFRYRKPDASLSANGWISGLVAGSAGCASVSPAASVIIGVVAGLLVTYLVEFFELKLYVDDPGGAISVHTGAGIWGLLAAGLFAQQAAGHRLAQIVAQVIGIATLLGVMLPLIHIGNLLLNRLVAFRVDTSGDWQGMDIRELGAGAYPEFVIHADEFTPD